MFEIIYPTASRFQTSEHPERPASLSTVKRDLHKLAKRLPTRKLFTSPKSMQSNRSETCRFPHGQAKCLLEKKTEFHRQNKDRVFLATITNNCVIVESSETLKIKNREYTKKYRDRGLVCENVLLPIVQREQKIKKGRITSK